MDPAVLKSFTENTLAKSRLCKKTLSWCLRSVNPVFDRRNHLQGDLVITLNAGATMFGRVPVEYYELRVWHKIPFSSKLPAGQFPNFSRVIQKTSMHFWGLIHFTKLYKFACSGCQQKWKHRIGFIRYGDHASLNDLCVTWMWIVISPCVLLRMVPTSLSRIVFHMFFNKL